MSVKIGDQVWRPFRTAGFRLRGWVPAVVVAVGRDRVDVVDDRHNRRITRRGTYRYRGGRIISFDAFELHPRDRRKQGKDRPAIR